MELLSYSDVAKLELHLLSNPEEVPLLPFQRQENSVLLGPSQAGL